MHIYTSATSPSALQIDTNSAILSDTQNHKFLLRIFCLPISILFTVCLFGQITPTLEQKYNLIKAWGSAKYTDPIISRGGINMDSVFISSYQHPDRSFHIMLVPSQKNGTYYTTSGCKDGLPCFKNEKRYATALMDSTPYRVLVIARFWNIIRYLSPDRAADAARWDSILIRVLVREESVKTHIDFDTVLLEMSALTRDPHSSIFGGSFGWMGDKFFPPIKITTIDGSLYISGSFDSLYHNDIGRRILSIDGKDVNEILTTYSKYAPAKNLAFAQQYISDQYVLPGDSGSAFHIVLEPSAGLENSLSIKRSLSFDVYHDLDNKLKRSGRVTGLSKDSILYIDLSQQVNAVWVKKQLRITKTAILDLRSYPDWKNFFILPYFLRKKIETAVSVGVDYKNLNHDISIRQALRGTGLYKGKIIVLVSENTVSRSEYFAAILKAYGAAATVMGSQTIGAMGESKFICLADKLFTAYTAMEVTFDGVSYFKKGISPDGIVHQRLENIKNGTDAVLLEAIKYARR